VSIPHTEETSNNAFRGLRKEPKKKPAPGKVRADFVLSTTDQSVEKGNDALLDFGFVVDNVLANHGIKFLDGHFVRHVALVLVGGIEVAGAGAGYQSDLVTHLRIPRLPPPRWAEQLTY